MKKILALVLCAVLLAAAGFAGVKFYEERKVVQAAEAKLFIQWDQYLSFRNEVDGITMWMNGYVEEFLQERSWDSLIRARAAVATGRRALKKVQPPTLNLDRETREVLGSESEMMIIVTQTITGAALEMQTTHSQYERIEMSLQDFFLYDTEMIDLDATMKQEKRILDCTEKYTACTTNYLFLEWDMEACWEEMLKAYPHFAQFCSPWESKKGSLEARAENLLDEYELAIQDSEVLLLYGGAINEDMQAAIDGDTGELTDQMRLPDGVSALFPMPNWLQTPRTIYYGQTIDGEMQVFTIDGDLENTPTSAYYYYDYVTENEVAEYLNYVERMGFSTYEKREEDGTWFTLIYKGEDTMAVQWTPYETVVLLSEPMVCLVSALDYQMLMQ